MQSSATGGSEEPSSCSIVDGTSESSGLNLNFKQTSDLGNNLVIETLYIPHQPRHHFPCGNAGPRYSDREVHCPQQRDPQATRGDARRDEFRLYASARPRTYAERTTPAAR